jgi:hypothetical protein
LSGPELNEESMNFKNRILPFIAALVACAAAFLLMDMIIMNMQGLSLIFHGS